MAEEVLSREEIDALLDGGEAKAGRTIADLDLARQPRLAGEHLRTLTRIAERMAIGFGEALSAALRTPVRGELIGVAEQSFSAWRAALSDPCVVHVLNAPPLDGRSLLGLDLNLVFGVLDRLLGGPGTPPAKVRAPTPLERTLLGNVTKRMLERVADSWRELAPIAPQVEALETVPGAVEAIPAGETVIVATVGLRGEAGFGGGECSLVLPLVALEPHLARLPRATTFAPPRAAPTPESRRRIDAVVGSTRVAVHVILGTTTLAIGEVLALKPGDVLVLDQGPDDPADGRVAGRLRFRGRAGRSGPHLAVLVASTQPASSA